MYNLTINSNCWKKEKEMPEIITMGELLVEIMRPGEDIPLEKTDYFRGPFPSGAPGIFVSTAARLGHEAAIISGVGKDDFGKCILDRLRHDGVDISRVLVSDEGNTGVAFVEYSRSGDRKFLFYMDGSPCVMAKVPDQDNNLKNVKVMHIMGCSLMSSLAFGREIVKTMYMMKELGARISFDPNLRLEMVKDPTVMDLLQEVFANTSILLPGVAELLFLTGESDLEKAIKKAFKNPVLEILALKNGSEGSRIYTNGELVAEQSVYPVEVLDPTGAGDSFDAALLCGLLEGRTLKDAAAMGSAAGALNTAAFGPMEGKITRKTIEEMMKS